MLSLCSQVQPFRRGKVRFIILFLLSIVVFGNQYAFNNPQSLQYYMRKDLQIGQAQFQLLHTIFIIPNIFATFFIGIIIDFFEVRLSTMVLALTASFTIFQIIIAFGGFLLSYTIILIGRMLFGIAYISLITAQVSMISFWFKGKQLAFSLGLTITVPQLGSALNSYMAPLIYEKFQNLGMPLLVSAFICMISLICALIAADIDKKADNYDQQNKTFTNHGEKQQIKLKCFKKLNSTFWSLVILCMFAEGLYVPFMAGVKDLFIKRFCFNPVGARRALMITYIITVICSAPLGFLIDYLGQKRCFIVICFLTYTLGHLILFSSPQCFQQQQYGATIGLILIGLGYCFYGSCLLPTIPLLVTKNITGTAFGIILMAESIANNFFPQINQYLILRGLSNQEAYRNSSLFFLLVSMTGMVFSVGLFYIPDRFIQELDQMSQKDQKLQQEQHGKKILSESQVRQYESQQPQEKPAEFKNRELNILLTQKYSKESENNLF